MVSQELIADRLECMLRQIQKGSAKQVLLHTALLAGTLDSSYPKAQTVRDMVHEALAWFLRGNRHRAEKRLKDALDVWSAGEGDIRTFRSHAAQA